MVGSVTDANGIATEYTYSTAGLVTRIVRKDGADKYTYDYHVDGQLATATYGSTTEDFLWDGLALVKRGKRGFVDEPHIGNAPQKLCFGGKPRAKRSARRARKGPRGNPVMSSDGTTYFNDMPGTTLSSSVNGETATPSLTAFGAETHNSKLTTHNPASDSFFTGKPFVPGLGHAFLFRNYRSDLGKWQTADPLGYPDGWNQLAYCNNGVMDFIDLGGGRKHRHEAHYLGPRTVSMTIPASDDLKYGVEYHGYCDGDGNITCTSQLMNGGLEGDAAVEVSDVRFSNQADPVIKYSGFSVSEVPGTRKSGKGFLEFYAQVSYTITYTYWVDKESKIISETSVHYYGKPQHVSFKCEE